MKNDDNGKEELERKMILSKNATYQIDEEIPSNRESPSDLLMQEHLTPIDAANKENCYATNQRGHSKQLAKPS